MKQHNFLRGARINLSEPIDDWLPREPESSDERGEVIRVAAFDEQA